MPKVVLYSTYTEQRKYCVTNAEEDYWYWQTAILSHILVTVQYLRYASYYGCVRFRKSKFGFCGPFTCFIFVWEIPITDFRSKKYVARKNLADYSKSRFLEIYHLFILINNGLGQRHAKTSDVSVSS